MSFSEDDQNIEALVEKQSLTVRPVPFLNNESAYYSCYKIRETLLFFCIYYGCTLTILQEVSMQTARIFNNGNSQAVRLPKEFRFEEDEVIIKKVGDMVILLPKKYKAETLLAMFEEIGPMEIEREQPMEQQERDFE
jgi:antitoxin VapB